MAAVNIDRGGALYKQACVVCHGADGKGNHGAGASLANLKDLEATIRTVSAGRDEMPPFGGTFDAAQIRDISAYVLQTLAGQSPR